MAAERERHGIELFPRGGTHWNALGAGLATTRLVALLKAQSTRLDLGPIDTTWTISRDPQGTDRDLVSMLNLYWFDTDYAVPKITHDSSQKDKSCRAAKIMEVGGSFLEQVNTALMDSRCPPHISYWFYWNFYHIVYAEGRRRSTPPRDEDRPADLVASDVILLEENEYNIGVTEHLNALHSFVASIAQKNSAGGADTR
jgi:hypothetical protein